MIQSAELGELFTALAEFQSRVGAIPKTATNPFFKSKYAALPDVVAAASPILTECGLCISQHLGHDERGDTLTTIVGHKSGQHIGDTMHLRPVKDDPQAQGSATSYGRRYAYMAALGLVADEDDDGNKASGKAPAAKANNGRSKPKDAPKVDRARAEQLAETAFTVGVQDKLQLAASHVVGADIGDCSTQEAATKALSGLTVEQADKVERWIDRKLEEIAAKETAPEAVAAEHGKRR